MKNENCGPYQKECGFPIVKDYMFNLANILGKNYTTKIEDFIYVNKRYSTITTDEEVDEFNRIGNLTGLADILNPGVSTILIFTGTIDTPSYFNITEDPVPY